MHECMQGDSMYTVRRGSSYDFQIRVPQPFVKRLGVTHLRATLGRISAPEARRRASILAGGILEILMSSVSSTASRIGKLSDEELLATCRWWLRQEPWSGILKRDIDALAPGELFQRKSTLARNFIQGLAISHFHEESGTWDDEVGIWDARRDEGEQALQASGYRNPTSADCLRAADVMEKLINDRVEARYRELITPDDALAPVAIVPPQPMPPPSAPVEPGITADTLLSVAWTPEIEARRDALKREGKDTRYIEHIENSAAAFLELIGDRPLRTYMPADLQNFSSRLAKVPVSRTTRPEFRGLSMKAAAEKNARLKSPLPCMSARTIKSYENEIRTLWNRATAGVMNVRPITQIRVSPPKDAPESVIRQGFPPQALSKWLADAATRREARKRWFPLLGLLTGLRLAELVYLQPKDICEYQGRLIIDLRTPLVVDGKESKRPLKTKTSARIVALHQLLFDLGFVDWARSQRGPWLFPECHDASDPADATQKAMNFWIKKLGVHTRLEQTFHSLRHNANSWITLRLSLQIANSQTGHAPATVAEGYLFRLLQPEEIDMIRTCAPPTDVDFSPYLTAAPSVGRPMLRRKTVRHIKA